MNGLKFSRKQLGIPYAVFLIAFVVVPLLLIILYAFTKKVPADKATFTIAGESVSFTVSNFSDFFSKSANIRVLFVSFGLAIITTIVSLLIAYPVAYILSKSKFNKGGVLLVLFILPLWINFVLRTAAMKELLYFIGMYKSNSFSFVNTLIGMVYDYLPFVIMPLYSVLMKIDKSYAEASADLGAKPATTFLSVTLPLSMPGIVSAVSMVLLPTTTSYVISDTLGNGNVTIVGKIIETQFLTMDNWHAGSTIALVLLVIIFFSMFLSGKFTEEKDESATRGTLW